MPFFNPGQNPARYMYMALVYIRAGVNSAPELEFIANFNSGIGIELELSSLELESLEMNMN